MIQNGVPHPCLSNLKAPSSHLGTLGTKDIVGGSEIMPDLAHLYQVSTWCWFTEREWRMKLTYAVCTKIRIQLPLPCDRPVVWVLIRMNAKCWGRGLSLSPNGYCHWAIRCSGSHLGQGSKLKEQQQDIAHAFNSVIRWQKGRCQLLGILFSPISTMKGITSLTKETHRRGPCLFCGMDSKAGVERHFTEMGNGAWVKVLRTVRPPSGPGWSGHTGVL